MDNEKRLIDANSLYQRLNERANDYALLDECTEQVIRDDMEIVQEQPTVDAVEVVRCKDCCSCLIDNSIREHHLCMRGYPLLQKRVKLDDFCSYGKRKEGASNG